MKKKVIILALSSILTISGTSLAYGLSRNNDSSNNYKVQMMSTQSSDIKLSSNYITTTMGISETMDRSNNDFNKMTDVMKKMDFMMRQML